MFRKDFYKDLCQQNLRITESLCAKNEKIRENVAKTVTYDDVRKIRFYDSSDPAFESREEELKNPLVIRREFSRSEKAQVAIIFQDSVDCAFFLQKQGYNPLLLNMASDFTPGGGWRNGALAQEECLFYRSLYYLSLEPQKAYPLGNYACIYSPNVYFFRCGQKINKDLTPSAIQPWDILDSREHRFISCIAMPALRRPILTEEGNLSREDAEITRQKLHGIMKVAALHGHDSVILGAMGCGAFRNPPKHVATIMSEVIHKYRNIFRKIVIPILDYNGSKNFEIFREIMKEEDEKREKKLKEDIECLTEFINRPKPPATELQKFLSDCHFPESDGDSETKLTEKEQQDYESALRATLGK